jgi:hypothetical protein
MRQTIALVAMIARRIRSVGARKKSFMFTLAPGWLDAFYQKNWASACAGMSV